MAGKKKGKRPSPLSAKATALLYREERHSLLQKVIECDRVLYLIEGPPELQDHIDALRRDIAQRAYDILVSSTSALEPSTGSRVARPR